MARPVTLKNRVKILLNVSGEQKKQLDRLAEKIGRPWGEIVREGIDVMLTKYGKRKTRA
jgi:predicted DNA-binding protein